MAEMTYLQAISDGLRTEMRRDKRVFLIGEDVGVYGGAFKVSLGFQEEFGPWRVIDPPLAEGLTGLKPGAHVMVVFVFHRATGHELLQHPRGDAARPKRGVFALCSPHRPNPIGVTVAELLGAEGNVLVVRGLDAINGTPVLDIKPA